MASSAQTFNSQIKAQLQNLGSPKFKLFAQAQEKSPTSSGIQKIQLGKILQKESNNQSQSPDDQNRGLLQKIQMKGLAFIPAKGQSPVSHNMQLQSCNITNQNQVDYQQTKLSPQRIIASNTTNGKVVIPANQIKIIKNASPSPEGRQPKIKQLSPTSITFINQNNNNQNTNPNVITNGGVSALINKVSQKSNPKTAQNKFQSSQLSDDETNVNSDNEERVSTVSQMKPDQNNFNRPKISTNPSQSSIHSVFTDQTLQNQRTQRGSALQHGADSQRVKVINPNKIRHSPSPPHNQAMKNDKAPVVTNLNIQPQGKRQQSPPQLASDFIKGMINQSRTNNLQMQGTTSKKVIAGIQSTLKKQNVTNFTKDMNKHGLAKDVQEVSNFNNILSENSPIRQEDATQGKAYQNPQKLPIQKIKYIRNYSPPPTYDQNGPTVISNIVVKESKLPRKIIEKPQEGNSPTNTSTQNDEKQDGDKASVFQFPFQRRARSLSLTKQEQGKTGQNQTSGAQAECDTSQSPIRPIETQESRRNKPVVANVNFVIAQQGLIKGRPQDESVFERNKEVDEWLMGSGESSVTAASNNSLNPLKNPQFLQICKKQELEKPVQPAAQKDNCDNSQGDDDMEDWMFRTFDKHKGGKKQEEKDSQRMQLSRLPQSNRNGQFDFESELEEESPFDMAPEMQKQFCKQTTKDNNGCFKLEHIVSDCNDLSQYIDKIDQFMMENIL